jgi:Ca2+-binding EF-hand superfamily protein
MICNNDDEKQQSQTSNIDSLPPGTPENKLKLFFDMYDVTGEGKLDREAFKKMMK